MTLLDWIPSLSTTMALALALWLARKLIATRLVMSVKHEFDSKLEMLRSQLRESEAALGADLRAKEAEIDALRRGALSTAAGRNRRGMNGDFRRSMKCGRQSFPWCLHARSRDS
jgi:hypothetical protein